MQKKVMRFCVLNSQEMQKWIAIYKNEKQQCTANRMLFKHNHVTQKLPYLADLQKLLNFLSQWWVDSTISKAKESGVQIFEEEEEISKGCDWLVSQSTYMHSIRLLE